MSDRSKLLARLADVDKIINQLRRSARARAKRDARALVAQFGLSPADVFGLPALLTKKFAPRYRDSVPEKK